MGISWEERLKGLEAGAEMCTYDAVTLVASIGGKELLLWTGPERCRELAHRMQQAGIKPEWEVFSPAHVIQDVKTLIDAGFDKPPYFINIVLGTASRLPERAAIFTEDVADDGSTYCRRTASSASAASARRSFPRFANALLLGGHVRVGLEDNLYFAKGEPATNLQLTERAVRIIRELGFEPATPAEARAMMGLQPH